MDSEVVLNNLPTELPVISFDIDIYMEQPVERRETKPERREKIPVGRPRKPLLKILPTPSDYPDLPLEDAKNLITRVIRSNTSRRYRRSDSKRLTKLVQKCIKLQANNDKLTKKYLKLDCDIKSLCQWLMEGTVNKK